ncbi:phage major capsid protein [Geodermatophilus sp. CPCC 205761]|uniref:phage major capsid protein n=1 Tax=Geodermatophilus sp. CPCC 205761 TaxID=2936597 RepID=UPI003EEE3FF8
MTITLTSLRNSNDTALRTLKPADMLDARRVLRDASDQHLATMRRITDAVEVAGRSELTKAQRADYQAAENGLDELTPIARKIEDEIAMRAIREQSGGLGTGEWVDHRGNRTPMDGIPGTGGEYRDGAPLNDRQSFAGFVRATGQVREDESGLSLTKYLRGALFGDWRGADDERRAMSGVAAAQGGLLVPPVLAAEIIDKARAATRVMQAGARIVPMANRTVDIARWVDDPEPTWRGEGDPITVDDATLDALELKARSLAVVTKVTRELLEDAQEVEQQLRAAFAAKFAEKIDAAALYGAGGDEPTGLINTTGVTKTNVAANGGPPTFDQLVDSVGRVRDAAEEPTAQILADRTARSLAKAKDTAGQYLPAPSYLDGVRRLTTSGVPVNLTTGTNADTSDVFTGDFSKLYVGVRTELTITVLSERYMQEEGSYGLVAWYRGDIGVARPKAFDIVRGVRA